MLACWGIPWQHKARKRGFITEFDYLAISALTPPTVSVDAPETRLEFPDNRLLIDLFGELNRNLTHIEDGRVGWVMEQNP